MKRLMLDYWRRWWWVLTLGVVLEFWLGWLIASSPAYGFEFWALMISMWTGATLLNFDLQRGVVRTVLALPLTAAQIGRGWWLATVGVPAFVLAVLLFLGAGVCCQLHPGRAFPADRLLIASLLTLIWLGTWFTATSGGNAGLSGDSKERTRAGLIGMLSTMMMFGSMLLCQGAAEKPARLALLLGLGGFLTVAGWFRAERCVLGRASFRLGALHAKTARGQHRVPLGDGGIPYLVRTSCGRGFLYLVAMAALMALLMAWQGERFPGAPGPVSFAVTMFATMSSFMSAWFILFFQLMPALRQVRFWRTLPVSASGLAGLLMAIAILPLVALGVLVTGVTGLLLGTHSAMATLEYYLLILAPMSFCVFCAVWRGLGKQAYVWLLVILFGFQMGPLGLRRWVPSPEIQLGFSGALVGLCLVMAFLLTRYSLRHNSHAYRFQGVQADFFDPLAGMRNN